MAWLSDIFYFIFRATAYKFMFKSAKKKGLLIYLKTLQVIRRSLLALVLIFTALQIMIFGFIGLVVTGVFMTPMDPNTRLLTLLWIFAALFIVPLILLFILFSNRLWLHYSGVESNVVDVMEKSGL